MFPYRLAAIDLDDTLLGPDKQISSANLAALRRLQELGVRIVLASGRRHENMVPFHESLGLRGPIVSCQGALVKDGTAVLSRECVPAGLGATLVAEGKRRDITQLYYHLDAVFVHRLDDLTAMYQQRTRCPLQTHEDLTHMQGEWMLKVIWLAPPARVAELYTEMVEDFRDRLNIVVTDPEYLEFIAHGVNKAVGLARAAAYLGIDQSAVLAFGDGDNDIEMIAWAGMGVAMSHGKSGARAVAKLVAPPGDPATSFARAVDVLINRHVAVA